MGDEDGRTFVDMLTDDEATSPVEETARKAWAARLPELLNTLEPIEAHILRWRFGLDGEAEQTLKTIGDHYNLSRERIRQIQQVALNKLRRQIPAED
jgi:RNA polymerase primary sigma factor